MVKKARELRQIPKREQLLAGQTVRKEMQVTAQL
jgi:hypothetical protein